MQGPTNYVGRFTYRDKLWDKPSKAILDLQDRSQRSWRPPGKKNTYSLYRQEHAEIRLFESIIQKLATVKKRFRKLKEIKGKASYLSVSRLQNVLNICVNTVTLSSSWEIWWCTFILYSFKRWLRKIWWWSCRDKAKVRMLIWVENKM